MTVIDPPLGFAVGAVDPGGAVRVAVVGNLDLMSLVSSRHALVLAATEVDGASTVVLDLTQAGLVDAVGVGTIVLVNRRLHARGVRLEIVAGGFALRVLDLVGLPAVIPTARIPAPRQAPASGGVGRSAGLDVAEA